MTIRHIIDLSVDSGTLFLLIKLAKRVTIAKFIFDNEGQICLRTTLPGGRDLRRRNPLVIKITRYCLDNEDA